MHPTLNKQLYALLGSLRIDADTKATMVYNHTAGRSTSTTALTNEEAKALIQALQAQNPIPITQNTNTSYTANTAQLQRRRCIAIAHQLGWKLPSGKADIPRLNDWCIKYGSAHIPLNALTRPQLQVIIYQLEVMLENQNAALRKI